MTNDQLLADFVSHRDNSAFEALVRRYGPMVFRVCRDIIGDHEGAEDAFQATFLVLLRQAGSIHDRSSVGRWLYEVACRISRRESRRVARLRSQERQAPAMDPEAPPDFDPADREMKPILHDEISRLPSKLRDAIVLCYLEGLTVEEAARRLRCPVGTLKSRLGRGRELLRSRLTRRGLAASVLLLLMFSLTEEVSASVPEPLLDVTLKAGRTGFEGVDVSRRVAAMVIEEETKKRWARMVASWGFLIVLLIVFGVARISTARKAQAALINPLVGPIVPPTSTGATTVVAPDIVRRHDGPVNLNRMFGADLRVGPISLGARRGWPPRAARVLRPFPEASVREHKLSRELAATRRRPAVAVEDLLMRNASRPAIILGVATLIGITIPAHSRAGYSVTDIASDIPGLAANTDANLKNPWGVSAAPNGPFWVSDQAASKSTLYGGTGSPLSLVVSIPTATGGPNGPTGQVFNGNTADFLIAGKGASFLFANLNGQISGWDGGTAATTLIPSSGAIYTGLAIGQVGSDNVLFAADSKGNKVDVYDSKFTNLNGTTYAGGFVNPNLPAGSKIFNIQNLGGVLYATYDNSTGGSAATGGGVVAEFGLDGHFIKQLISNGPGGPLEDPWGVVLAPSTFGQFGGDLLVGNKEAGTINAFDPTTGAFRGLVATVTNDPTSTNNGLWGLEFGTGAAGSSPDTLYAFAGINNEADGLIAAINPVPEPGSMALMTIGGAFALVVARLRRRASTRG